MSSTASNTASKLESSSLSLFSTGDATVGYDQNSTEEAKEESNQKLDRKSQKTDNSSLSGAHFVVLNRGFVRLVKFARKLVSFFSFEVHFVSSVAPKLASPSLSLFSTGDATVGYNQDSTEEAKEESNQKLDRKSQKTDNSSLSGAPFVVLNRGFVRLVDSMGSDAAIVQAARVSYGKGTKKMRDDRALIRYLMCHHHSSPFEMCEVKLHVKLPLFVARQWVRHRTASLNEYSARYSEMVKEFYVPIEPDVEDSLLGEEARLGKQSQENRQGRSEDTTLRQRDKRLSLTNRLEKSAHDAFLSYRYLLGKGVSRELARITLPLSTYTEFYWKANLHNLFHFLKLRMGKHAQTEIRLYAQTIFEKIVRPLFPQASEAFTDYRLESQCLSRSELALLRKLVKGKKLVRPDGDFSTREWEGFLKCFALKEKEKNEG